MSDTPRITVRIGLLPTFRFRYSDWCREMHDRAVKALEQVRGLELVRLPQGDDTPLTEGTVHNLDQAEFAAKHFATQGIDGLVVCPLDFGDERSVAKVVEKLQVPTLLFATKEPPANDDTGLSRVSDSYCGTLSIASAFYRREIPFRFAGIAFPEDQALRDELDTFVAAVSVVSGMRNARLGQVGVRPPTFETVAYDEVGLIKKFGQNVIYQNINDIAHRALELADDDPRVQDRMAFIRETAATTLLGDEYFVPAAKLEVTLKEWYDSQKLSVMGIQCWPSIGRDMGIEVCSTFGRLTGDHMLTACEADMLGALSMLINYRAALGDTVPHFIDWTIKHRDHDNRFLAWHCGNAPTCLAANPDDIALRTRANMTGAPDAGGKGGLYQFQLKPGDVTLCRLAEYNNQWKLLVTTGTIVPSDETLAGTWSWVEVPDHDHLYRVLVEEGFIHHASMIHGDQVTALREACGFLGVGVVEV